jgi:hypothetical protein
MKVARVAGRCVVDEDEILDQVQRYGFPFTTVTLRGLGTGERAQIRLVEILEPWTPGHTRRDNGVQILDSCMSREGPTLTVKLPEHTDFFLQWLASLASRLETLNRKVTIGGAPTGWLPIGFPLPSVQSITAGVSLRTDLKRYYLLHQAGPTNPLEWLVDSVTTRIVVEAATQWCLQDAREAFVGQGPLHKRSERDVIVDKVLDVLGGEGDVGVVVTGFGGSGQFRCVAFGLLGHIVAQRSLTSPVADGIGEMRSLLVSLAPHANYGFVRRRTATTQHWSWALASPGHSNTWSNSNYVQLTHELEDGKVPDVFGIQLLTERHAASISDRSRWNITPVFADRFLCEAVDLDPWFNSAEPDPTTLESARKDFTAAVLTAADLKAAHDQRQDRAAE